MLYYFYDDDLGRLVAQPDSNAAESVISAMNLAFNQLTIGNLGSNDRFCGSGFVDGLGSTNSSTTTLAAGAGSGGDVVELACDYGSTISVASTFYGVVNGTCDCPVDQSPTSGACPGEIRFVRACMYACLRACVCACIFLPHERVSPGCQVVSI